MVGMMADLNFLLMTHTDHIATAIPAFATAGTAAIGALGSRVLGATVELPGGLERLLDLGFAGVFIAALIYGMRAVWASKHESERKHEELEKEIRERLLNELEQANRTRAELIQLMRDK
jgi:hypothetical protein